MAVRTVFSGQVRSDPWLPGYLDVEGGHPGRRGLNPKSSPAEEDEESDMAGQVQVDTVLMHNTALAGTARTVTDPGDEMTADGRQLSSQPRAQ